MLRFLNKNSASLWKNERQAKKFYIMEKKLCFKKAKYYYNKKQKEQGFCETEKRILLRPHHMVCLMFFEGKGYSDGFVKNMEHILQQLLKGAKIAITNSCDSVCAFCPNNVDGECVSDECVKRFDETVKEVCALRENVEYSFGQLKKTAHCQIISKDKLFQICGSCQWYGICERKCRELF